MQLRNTLFIPFLMLVMGKVSAQEEMKPVRYENPEWHMVNLFSFHRSHQARAMEILEQYLIPATRKAGTTFQVHELNTGEYQLMLMVKLNGGPDDLNWLFAPDQIEWIKALGEVAGGPDKAQPIMAEWQAAISGAQTQLARKLH